MIKKFVFLFKMEKNDLFYEIYTFRSGLGTKYGLETKTR